MWTIVLSVLGESTVSVELLIFRSKKAHHQHKDIVALLNLRASDPTLKKAKQPYFFCMWIERMKTLGCLTIHSHELIIPILMLINKIADNSEANSVEL